MACGCKNKVSSSGNSARVVKTTSNSSQESKPQKTVNGTRIIKREIR